METRRRWLDDTARELFDQLIDKQRQMIDQVIGDAMHTGVGIAHVKAVSASEIASAKNAADRLVLERRHRDLQRQLEPMQREAALLIERYSVADVFVSAADQSEVLGHAQD